MVESLRLQSSERFCQNTFRFFFFFFVNKYSQKSPMLERIFKFYQNAFRVLPECLSISDRMPFRFCQNAFWILIDFFFFFSINIARHLRCWRGFLDFTHCLLDSVRMPFGFYQNAFWIDFYFLFSINITLDVSNAGETFSII